MDDGEGGRRREREGRAGVAAVDAASTRCAAPVGELTGACIGFAAGGGERTGGATRAVAAAERDRREGGRERGSSGSNGSGDGAMALIEI
jgi:hypothetical protein